MKYIGGATVPLILVLLPACSSIGPKPTPVWGGTTVSLDGFSFVVPYREAYVFYWTFTSRSNSGVSLTSFVEQGKNCLYCAYGVQAYRFPVTSRGTDEAFSVWFKRRLAKTDRPSDEVYEEFQSYTLEGAECVRSHSRKHIDRELRGKHLLDSFELVCSHPDKRSVGVYVRYGQKYYNSEALDPQLADTASRLFESVRFTPP